MSFTYDDGTTEPFVFAQPDAKGLVLSGLNPTLSFTPAARATK